MSDLKIEFEGKIKVTENFGVKKLLELLKFLTNDLGFTIKKIDSDEIKLVKSDFSIKHKGVVETTKSNLKIEVEIELEVSDTELEVEVESESADAVNTLIAQIAAKL
jgi:hypothetical protein